MLKINFISIRIVFLLSLAFSLQLSVTAQEVDFCGIHEATIRTFGLTPAELFERSNAEILLEQETVDYVSSGSRAGTIIIPVVFHVIHFNGPENISNDQIYDALKVVNRDYNKLNPDINEVVDAFAGIAADVDIEFRLARKDPDGNCHSGINRIVSNLTYDGDEFAKLLIQWPRNRYLNIWVCAEAAGAAGYSLYPSSVNGFNNADMDGIMIKSSYVGSIGTSNSFRSRVLSHEIGHWLNLRHPWGNSNSPGDATNCNTDDNVADTPNTIGWTTCNLEGVSCGSIDNIQNYMEYAYCGRMFTEGQKTRLRAAALSGIAQRSNLSTDTNLLITGVFGDPMVCEAVFSVNKRVICVGDSVLVNDESYHDVTSWSWDFSDGTLLSGSELGVNNITYHTFNTAGSYEIILTASNSFDSKISEPVSITVLPAGAMASPTVQGFELDEFPSNDWFIDDTNSDGGWNVTDVASYSGSRALRLNNYSNEIELNKDYLISSTMDLSSAVQVRIHYRWAYCFKGFTDDDETDDRLRVSVTGDCGEDWDLRRMHRGYTDLASAPPHSIPFIPEGNWEWKEYTLILDQSVYLTSNFRVMFEFESRLGNDIYLDDINITAYDSSMLDVNELYTETTWNLFPNPTVAESTLECTMTELNDNSSISIYDGSGRLVEVIYEGVLTQGKHRFPLSTIGLSTGTYFVVVNTEGKSKALPWIIRQ